MASSCYDSFEVAKTSFAAILGAIRDSTKCAMTGQEDYNIDMKLPCGILPLLIETGSYQGVAAGNRYYRDCDTNEVETEYYDCPILIDTQS